MRKIILIIVTLISFVGILLFLREYLSPKVQTIEKISNIIKIPQSINKTKTKKLESTIKELGADSVIVGIESGSIAEIKKTKEGIEIRNNDVPREGKVFLTYNTKTSKFKYKIKSAGLCFYPLIGIGSDKELILGLRFFYLKKFGINLGLSKKGFQIGIGYRLPYFSSIILSPGWKFCYSGNHYPLISLFISLR